MVLNKDPQQNWFSVEVKEPSENLVNYLFAKRYCITTVSIVAWKTFSTNFHDMLLYCHYLKKSFLFDAEKVLEGEIDREILQLGRHSSLHLDYRKVQRNKLHYCTFLTEEREAEDSLRAIK